MTIYAIQKLSQPNIYLYLDAGHAGWLGWPANISPAAQLFGDLLKSAGGSYRVRGLATSECFLNNSVSKSLLIMFVRRCQLQRHHCRLPRPGYSSQPELRRGALHCCSYPSPPAKQLPWYVYVTALEYSHITYLILFQPTSLLIRAAPVSRTSVMLGATGATSRVQDSVSAPELATSLVSSQFFFFRS